MFFCQVLSSGKIDYAGQPIGAILAGTSAFAHYYVCPVCVSSRCYCVLFIIWYTSVCHVSPALCVSQPGVSVSAVYPLHCVYLSQVCLCLLCITCTVSQPGVSASALRPVPKLCGCFFTSRTEPPLPACKNYTVSHSNVPSQSPVFICRSVHCWGNRDQRHLPSSYQRPVCCTHAPLTLSWAVGDSGLSVMRVA